MRQIDLGDGLVSTVDDADYERIGGLGWYATTRGDRKYAVRRIGTDDGFTVSYLHRELLGNPDGEVRHDNGDSLDNRRANLRFTPRKVRRWTSTTKHNMRMPDEIWDAAVLKSARLAALGYQGENGPYSTTDLCRDSLWAASEETDERTILRLGLTKGEPAEVRP